MRVRTRGILQAAIIAAAACSAQAGIDPVFVGPQNVGGNTIDGGSFEIDVNDNPTNFAGIFGVNGDGITTPSFGLYSSTATGIHPLLLDTQQFAGGVITDHIDDYRMNNTGGAAVISEFTNDNGATHHGGLFYVDSGGSFAPLALFGQTTPVGGTYQYFSQESINSSGLVSFLNTVPNPTFGQPGEAIFVARANGPVTNIVAGGQTAPGTTYLNSPNTFKTFEASLVSDSGGVAFNTTLSLGLSTAIYFGAPGHAPVPYVFEGDAVPGLSGITMVNPFLTAINSSNEIVYEGFLSGNFQTTPNQGLFTATPGGVSVPVAIQLQAVPGVPGNMRFNNFAHERLNNAGQVLFIGGMRDPNGVINSNGGLFLSDPVHGITPIAYAGQTLPDGNVVTGIGEDYLTSGGTVSFLATSSNDDQNGGIYLADSQQTIATGMHVGQNLPGFGTLTDLDLLGMNEYGQISAEVGGASGFGAIVYTPELHYRAAVSGTWDNAKNWTVGLAPAVVHDVFIDPAASLTVAGPSTPTSVNSLTVNGTSGATATLALQSGGPLTVMHGFTVGPSGILTGNGAVIGDISTTGVVHPTGLAPSILVTGNFAQAAAGNLITDIAGTQNGQYSVVLVDGDASLAGMLTLNFTDGFAPHAGDVFDLLRMTPGSDRTGTFDQVIVDGLAPGFQFVLASDATGGLEVIATTDGVATSAVPEPTMVSVISAAMFLLRRRRDKTCRTN